MTPEISLIARIVLREGEKGKNTQKTTKSNFNALEIRNISHSFNSSVQFVINIINPYLYLLKVVFLNKLC